MTKAPSCRHVVLAGDVGDAEQQRGEERAGDARRAADRDDDQEVDHELEREGRIEPEDLGAERAAEAGEPGADGEGQRRRPQLTLMPSPRATRAVVDRGAQPAAEAGACASDELQRDRQQRRRRR